MSGIIGSKLNIRGSGRIAKLGTDGQVLTSSGAGVAAAFEDASAGGTSWQSVETGATFTAVAGNGYPVNTTAQACTVTLPASASVGDEIIFTDYARNFATNALTIDQNSLKYQGQTSPNPVYDTAGESIHIVYMDATKGWIPTYDGAVADEVPQTADHEYLIVAGGGSGGEATDGSSWGRGGGGAGGYLTNYGGTAISLTGGTTYTITVGTGSSTGGGNGGDSALTGSDITDVTSTGGGGGVNQQSAGPANDGGSGGGAGYHPSTGGSGVAGPPRQGYDGGDAVAGGSAAGGGGSSAVGADSETNDGGAGGAGTANSITGSSVTYAGGGGGGSYTGGGAAGAGGGGVSYMYNPARVATQGTDGLGGGGGGGGFSAGTNPEPGDGGNGIVILRMADGDAGTPTNEDSVATDVGGSGETVITWLVDGSYVA